MVHQRKNTSNALLTRTKHHEYGSHFGSSPVSSISLFVQYWHLIMDEHIKAVRLQYVYIYIYALVWCCGPGGSGRVRCPGDHICMHFPQRKYSKLASLKKKSMPCTYCCTTFWLTLNQFVATAFCAASFLIFFMKSSPI